MNPVTQTPLGLIIEIVWLVLMLDCLVAGYRATLTGVVPRTPKLLGYLFLRVVEIGQAKYKGSSQFLRVFYSTRAMGVYLMIAGARLAIGATLAIAEFVR